MTTTQAVGHTPGPWKALPDTGSESFAFEVTGQRMEGVALVYAYDTPSAANARLIAAAPDLLEALQSLLRFENMAVIGDGTGMRDAEIRRSFAVARGAIAKAEGRRTMAYPVRPAHFRGP
jgi:hypothetical protein